VGLEIERKFLLKNSQILDFLKEAGVVFKHLEISQFYTKITQNEEIRFRSEEGKFIKTINYAHKHESTTKPTNIKQRKKKCLVTI